MAKKDKRGTGRSKQGDPRRDSQSAPPLTANPSPPPAASAQPVTGRLYTQCPSCKTIYRIGLAQLRQGGGEAFCLECQASFNALPGLAETAERAAAASCPIMQIPMLGRMDAAGRSLHREIDGEGEQAAAVLAQKPVSLAPANARMVWWIGTGVLIGLLTLQWGWFAGPGLAQNEHLRPSLEKACEFLGCRLPLFHAPRHIQIIQHDLRPAPEGLEGYEFTLVLANQALLPQSFPAIRLSLEAHNGQPAAVREFQPEEYRKKNSSKLMPVGELTEIRLLIARPSKEIGGFSFELF